MVRPTGTGAVTYLYVYQYVTGNGVVNVAQFVAQKVAQDAHRILGGFCLMWETEKQNLHIPQDEVAPALCKVNLITLMYSRLLYLCFLIVSYFNEVF